MKNKERNLKTLIVIFISLLANSFVHGQKNECDDDLPGINSRGGIAGFYVRHIGNETQFLNFTASSKGCLIKGVIENKDNCKDLKRYDYQIEDNLLFINELGTSDTLVIETLDCKKLILKNYTEKNLKSNKDTTQYFRQLGNACEVFDCFPFCSSDKKIESKGISTLRFYISIIRFKFAVAIAFYIGTFILLFLNFKNIQFVLSFLKFWVLLSLISCVFIYSSTHNVSYIKALYYICGMPSDKFFLLGFYTTSSSSFLSKSSFSFWYGSFLTISLLSFPCAIWYSWRKIIKKFNFKNKYLDRILNFLFLPAYAIIVIAPFILISVLFLVSLSMWIAEAPHNWILMIISYIAFFKYFTYFILSPFLKTDVRSLINFFSHGFKF